MFLRPLLQPQATWLDNPHPRRVAGAAIAAVVGLAAYGFSVGYWRSPMMGAYVAIKMPLLVACTLGCNALLNGLLGLLLGSGLGFRQSFLALLMSFAIAGLILGSLAPVLVFITSIAPDATSPGADTAHSTYLVAHTFLIGFAGVVANLHLHRLLAAKATNRNAATVTLLAWLGGNGFLGAQFSWVLRPFFGMPNMKVQFLRDDPMRGNFYESVWSSLTHITGGPVEAGFVLLLIMAAIAIPIVLSLRSYYQPRN